MGSQSSSDGHRQALLAEMHPSLQQLFEHRQVLDGRFQVVDVLGAGGFATVLKCVDLSCKAPGSKEVAAKVAIDAVTDDEGKLSDKQAREYRASMKHELSVYKDLLGAGSTAAHGIPAVFGTAYMRKPFDASNPAKLCFLSMLMLELLGKDVWHLACVLKVYRSNRALLVRHAVSMLKTLQHIHQQGYIHRDVKPENFCLPGGCEHASSADRLCIIDMGMAMKWSHAGFSWHKPDYIFYGTVDFASTRSLRGFHPSPKDDLESLACVLLEMAKGESAFSLLTDEEAGQPLPNERLLQLAEMKEKQWASYLSQDCTPGFVKQWMRHIRSLPLEAVPSSSDYELLEAVLRSNAPACTAATSAWSSAMPLQQLTGGGKKRHLAPALSNASCMSDTATVVQPKKLRGDSEDEEGFGLVSGVLMSTPNDE